MKKWIKDIMKGRKKELKPKKEKKSISELRVAMKEKVKKEKKEEGKKIDKDKIKKERKKK